MSMFSNFDATTPTAGVDSNSYSPFPAGTYTFVIDEAEETQSKAGNEMLRLAMSVSGGDHDGRKVWDYIVPDAAPFLAQKIKNLSLSAGLQTLTCADDLLGHKIRAKVKVEAARGEYDASNKVVDYVPRPAGMDAQAAEAATVPPRATSTGWSA